MTEQDIPIEHVCTACRELVHENQAHPALKKISELKGSELYKCGRCYSYLHKQGQFWEIISAQMPTKTANPSTASPAAEQVNSKSSLQYYEK